ncbi:uncharacterized protein LOC134812734 [Bolinopsis microptera]|uniref:uncharacterized protein LOC134812734 n=1 Tax=Bolinopsis microptera TaxID=2820187 RepID=UPI0030790C6A
MLLAMPENANRTKNTPAGSEGGKQSTVQCTFQTVNIVLILVQQRDDTFLLVQRADATGWWLPAGRVHEGETLQDAAIRKCREDGGINVNLKGVLRLEHTLVANDQARFRTIFYAQPADTTEYPVSEVVVKKKWMKLSEIKMCALRKPEPLQFAEYISQDGQIYPLSLLAVEGTPPPQQCRMHMSRSCGCNAKIVYSSIQMKMHRYLLDAAHFGPREQSLIMEYFDRVCGAQNTASLEIFTQLMAGFGFPPDQAPDFFRAFDIKKDNEITSQEFILGLAAMDPNTPHGSSSAEMRCRYIFRYYDKNLDGKLDFTEFCHMVGDIQRLKNPDISTEGIHEEAVQLAKVFSSEDKSSLYLTEFLTAVGMLKFRGTSSLFRLQKSAVKYDAVRSPQAPVTQKNDEEAKDMNVEGMTFSANDVNDNVKPGDPQYELAMHTVKVRRTGTISDVAVLWDSDQVKNLAMTLSSAQLCRANEEAKQKDGNLYNTLVIDRSHSVDTFNEHSNPNEMLSGLRYFERHIKSDPNNQGIPKSAFSWGCVDPNLLGTCMLSIAEQVQKVFVTEPRLLNLTSPTYILGDVHGNFHDLVAFEKVLWRMGPVLTPSNFLFLGDYVDRGDYGLEVVAYLFAQKLIAPQKFFLIRGNHEVRNIQQMFTFKSECLSKFGDVMGEKVWEAVNKCFDALPLAAVIDDKIFCVHGGIPSPENGGGYLSVFEDIPHDLPNPEKESRLAWEVMWSDPLREDELDTQTKEEVKDSGGFIANHRRGTAYLFSREALEAFLKRNKLSHVIRAHEVKQAGFQVQQNGKLLTVFSSSGYCGGTNQAACILADRNKIRTIRIDTS